jgi:hypothetical protein
MAMVFIRTSKGAEIELRDPKLTAAVQAALTDALTELSGTEQPAGKRGPGRPPKTQNAQTDGTEDTPPAAAM